MHQGILTQAVNLVQARIHVSFYEAEDWPDSVETIDLLHLQRLYISDENVLNYLRTPCLQEIAFCIDQEVDLNYVPHLDPFVLRSGCTLRRLSFDGPPTTRAVAEILLKYPSFTELAILYHLDSSHSRAHDLISHLIVPDFPGSVAMYPQLTDISWGSDNSYIDYSRYFDMLQSRRRTKGGALKSVDLLINSGTGLGRSTFRGLDVLRGEGMDILVLQGTEALKVMAGWTYAPSWI
ncbi:hypothetical protein C8R44DRAFT_766566, partial [Mycena epipterygia]